MRRGCAVRGGLKKGHPIGSGRCDGTPTRGVRLAPHLLREGFAQRELLPPFCGEAGIQFTMPLRSFADVPNRIVRLFLQEAGRQYDANRGLRPFGSMPKTLIDRFDGACAYCGEVGPLVEEHLVPMNRAAIGLHAWGNIVPSCKRCNDLKAARAWEVHPMLDPHRRTAISDYITESGYAPDVSELRVVLSKLYELADRQTRALVEFGLVASRPYIAGLNAAATDTADD